ncbi:MAG: circadian clock protein KaiA [Synechococcales cyanobacterium M58_A2018_015]|nr:circadian clock protein KaiA [Synechococcales cyanobacterium M58_A2018_015]
MRSPLSICILSCSEALTRSLSQYLRDALPPEDSPSRYTLHVFSSVQDFLQELKQENHAIDCLILEETTDLPLLLEQLQQEDILFPTVIVQSRPESDSAIQEDLSQTAKPEGDSSMAMPELAGHTATMRLTAQRLSQIGLMIDQAISKFIQMSPGQGSAATANEPEAPLSHKLMVQQMRLAEKLKERLGYLGVYYKRNPQNFLRHMTPSQREELLQQLKAEYRDIVLTYFSDDSRLNERIDNFVNVAFFADIPVSQIVEIHMDLMDEFSKQLKLEGRSDEILLDYRLTLIDTLAHLCEMYRRSIPRES